MAQPFPQHLPVRHEPLPDDSEYMAMASPTAINPPPEVSHQRPTVRSQYSDHPNPTNPSYGQLNPGLGSPPPLPPKPRLTPRQPSHMPPIRQRPPVGTRVGALPQRPPMGTPLGTPPQRPPFDMGTVIRALPEEAVANPRTVFNQPQPPMGTTTNIPPQQPPSRPLRYPASNDHEYTYITYTKDQQIQHLTKKVSDTEFKLREKEVELSRCNAELSKCRQCLMDKKREIEQQEQAIQRLTAENAQLRQSTVRAQPQVAQTEVALQSQVQHYRKTVEDLRAQIERLRRQPPPLPPHPPAPPVEMQEMHRLRGEVVWHQRERQRMQGEMDILSTQVKTYEEDFASERHDRERAQAKIEEMRGEIDNLNHITTILGGQQPP